MERYELWDAGLVISIVGTVITAAGYVYSRRASRGVDELRRTLAVRVHHERVTGKLNANYKNIKTLIGVRKGAELEEESAQAAAHLEELVPLLPELRNDLDSLMRAMRTPTGDRVAWAQSFLPRLSHILTRIENEMSKQTLRNAGV